MEFVGTYFSEELNTRYTVYFEDESLHIKVGYTPPLDLNFSRTDVFEGGFTFRFQRDGSGDVNGFRMDAGRVRNLKFVIRNFIGNHS